MNNNGSFPPLQYFREVQQELRKVTWPDRDETLQMTTVVLLVCLAMALYLGGLDFLLTEAITALLG